MDWVVDDCFLLEPKQEELIKIGWDTKNILIRNTRKIYFDLYRGRSIDLSKAMNIQDNEYFYKFLGIDKRTQNKIYHYTILSDSIEFEFCEDLTGKQQIIIDNAIDIFENLVQEILNRIQSEVDYLSSEDFALKTIECNDIVFLENGEISKF